MFSRWRLSHAQGYLALGLIDAADAELAALSPAEQDQPLALSLRATVFQAQERWAEMQSVTAELVRAQPDESGWWIMWAYATRRTESVKEAEAILRNAEQRHPRDATIKFNLGCYACVRGNLTLARSYIEQAIELDRAFAALAESDEDLVALRASGFVA